MYSKGEVAEGNWEARKRKLPVITTKLLVIQLSVIALHVFSATNCVSTHQNKIRDNNNSETEINTKKRIMHNVTWWHHKTASEIQERMGLQDLLTTITILKWQWAGLLGRMNDNRWMCCRTICSFGTIFSELVQNILNRYKIYWTGTILIVLVYFYQLSKKGIFLFLGCS